MQKRIQKIFQKKCKRKCTRKCKRECKRECEFWVVTTPCKRFLPPPAGERKKINTGSSVGWCWWWEFCCAFFFPPGFLQVVQMQLDSIGDPWKQPRFDSLPHVVEVLTSPNPEQTLQSLCEQRDLVEHLVDGVVHNYNTGFSKASSSAFLNLFWKEFTEQTAVAAELGGFFFLNIIIISSMCRSCGCSLIPQAK